MMKISDHEVIKSGEQELIDAITADLDWGAIEKVFKEKHNLGIEEDVEYQRGDIVVHNNQVAYKLEFNVNVVLSILLDREGKYISVITPGNLETSPSDSNNNPTEPSQTDLGELENHNGAASPESMPLSSTENDKNVSALSTVENPQEKISQMTSLAEEMISEMENENQEIVVGEES